MFNDININIVLGVKHTVLRQRDTYDKKITYPKMHNKIHKENIDYKL